MKLKLLLLTLLVAWCVPLTVEARRRKTMQKPGKIPQKLELTWVGKDEQIAIEPRILLEDAEKSNLSLSANGAKGIFDNMLIHGDNLLALKALEKQFAGKVKCIYIDPPYNTGAAFAQYDDNLEHSQWLNLMRPRLEILWKLLRIDGSIWISIDEDEGAYMKVLCDEVFGRQSFVSSMVWQKRTSPDMRAVISDAHDFILLYVKDKEQFKTARNRLPLSDEQAKNYGNKDNDPRGPWSSVDITGQTGHATSSQFYEITTPSGVKMRPPQGRCWALAESTFKELVADNRIWFGENGSSRPRKKVFLSESKGVVPWTWWTNKEVGHNQEARQESNVLFGADEAFDTPKPERLIHRIVHIASNPGDLVLDSFLGSGTTAAVAHKMGRRWIGVEMGDHAYTHCKVRLDKVISGEDKGGITKAVGWQGGGGYRFYELAPTLVKFDMLGEPVINERYNAEMLAAAVALHEGFTYAPDSRVFWRQSKGDAGGKSWLFTTTRHVSRQYLASIVQDMDEGEFLVVVCKSFDRGAASGWSNIKVKKIPQSLLDKCEFGKDGYALNVVADEESEENEE